MALVATAAEPQLRAYYLDVAISPADVPVGRPLTLRFGVRDPATRELVRELAVVHERPFHLFIVSDGLDWFAHVHPTQAEDGRFVVEQTLPRPGRYQLIADFVPAGAPAQLIQRTIVASGIAPGIASLPAVPVTVARAGELTATLTPGAVVATRPAVLELTVREPDGRGAALEPYLGADVHALAISADLVDAIHVHGQVVAGMPGVVRLALCFPRPGVYRLWAQLQRRGVVHTARFTVVASPMALP